MDFSQLLYPTLQYIGGVSPELFGQLKESWAGLHISILMDHYYREHSPSSGIFLGRNLP